MPPRREAPVSATGRTVFGVVISSLMRREGKLVAAHVGKTLLRLPYRSPKIVLMIDEAKSARVCLFDSAITFPQNLKDRNL
jgi:hypothetical protein